MSLRSASPEIRLPFFHHVEFEADDAPSLAFTLCRTLGMKPVARAVQPFGDSIWLQSGQAVLICSSARRGDAPQVRVSAIGFQTENLASAAMHFDRAFKNCADECEVVEDERGIVTLALPAALGALKLRFVRSETVASCSLPSGAPLAIVGYERVDYGSVDAPATGGGVIGIDHIAVNVDNAPQVCSALETLTGWAPFRVFSEEILQRPLSAQTLGSPTAEGLLTVVQPTEQASIFQKTLEANGGASVHHIALRCENLIGFTQTLAAAGAWRTMPPPENAYYEEIRPLAREFLDEIAFEKLQNCGMLLDFDHDCAIIQVFLPYLHTRPGVFFELIERLPRIEDRRLTGRIPARPGCGGFGDRNVRRLYDCLVGGMDQAPLLRPATPGQIGRRADVDCIDAILRRSSG